MLIFSEAVSNNNLNYHKTLEIQRFVCEKCTYVLHLSVNFTKIFSIILEFIKIYLEGDVHAITLFAMFGSKV